MLCYKSSTPLSKKVGKVMGEAKLIERLSEVLERELTGLEQAIVDWVATQIRIENLKLEENN
jgi:hypothetical protein